jgi:hypothetical protein
VLEHHLLLDVLLLIVIMVLLQPRLRRWWKRLHCTWQERQPRVWKPASPRDCPLCCSGLSLSVIKPGAVVPYAQHKSRRGRKKSVATRGFACPRIPKKLHFRENDTKTVANL